MSLLIKDMLLAFLATLLYCSKISLFCENWGGGVFPKQEARYLCFEGVFPISFETLCNNYRITESRILEKTSEIIESNLWSPPWQLEQSSMSSNFLNTSHLGAAQAGPAFPWPMLAGPDPLAVLCVLSDDTLNDHLYNLVGHQGQAETPLVPWILLLALLMDEHHI